MRELRNLRQPRPPPAWQPQRPYRARSAEGQRLGAWEARRDEHGPLHRRSWEGDVCQNMFHVTVQCGACHQGDVITEVKHKYFRADFGLSRINTMARNLCSIHGLSADTAAGATIQYTYSCEPLRFAWDSSLEAPAFLFFERSPTADITVTAKLGENVHRFSLGWASHGRLKKYRDYCSHPNEQMLQPADDHPLQRPPLTSIGRKGKFTVG